ncbi:hypothetical protein DFQ04_0039 [Algoriphagus boseongensis]|uniref:Uncharacterized protein n=1 Tax=Algoriphagus boseongensis TaxID=1442587 RepID=A0A4R6T6L5_9BACT|nr:hypothetical protein [Algoriphagus boseongensis]TDQ18241.1 hypothetical protein DFQ04_0039 [Algoriphagus boseongensis]
METITSEVLIASLGLLLISFPYLLHIYQSTKKEQAVCPSFQEFVETQNLHLDKIQSWRNHYTLGIDQEKNILVYCRHGHFPAQTLVRLDEVDHISLDTHFREIKHHRERQQKLEYLDLVLHFKDSSKASKSLPIYDETEVNHLADEYSIARKWASYIKQRIQPNQVPSLKWA